MAADAGEMSFAASIWRAAASTGTLLACLQMLADIAAGAEHQNSLRHTRLLNAVKMPASGHHLRKLLAVDIRCVTRRTIGEALISTPRAA
jgi:hypothetical protein